MSFLSTLGHIGSSILGFLPIPGAGIASKALDAASSVGDVLGHSGAAAASGRRGDADLEARMAIANNNARLNAAKFNMAAPETRYSQVAKGDLVNNVQDVGETGSGRDLHFTGGLRPSALGPASKQAATEMQRQALSALMTGSDKITPQISTLPGSGVMEKIGGIGGTVGGLAGAVGSTGILNGLGKVATMQAQPTPDWRPPQQPWDPEQQDTEE